MKKPIKIFKRKDYDFILVDWKMSTVCNYSCFFCGYHDGKQRWLSIEEYKLIATKLMDNADSLGKTIWFELLGGEPTVFPHLFELLELIRDRKHKVCLVSNGSRTIRWWKKLRDLNLVSIISISHHPEQNSNPNHIIEISKLFVDTDVQFIVKTTAPPRVFDKALAHHELFLKEAFAICSLKYIFSDEAYTEEQLSIIIKHTEFASNNGNNLKEVTNSLLDRQKLNIQFDDNSVEETSAQLLIRTKKNNFYGWHCSAGQTLLSIDYDVAYRAFCKVGGKISSVFDDDFRFMSLPIVCNLLQCNCASDVAAPKELIK